MSGGAWPRGRCPEGRGRVETGGAAHVAATPPPSRPTPLLLETFRVTLSIVGKVIKLR
jgi:hypothetical protein